MSDPNRAYDMIDVENHEMAREIRELKAKLATTRQEKEEEGLQIEQWSKAAKSFEIEHPKAYHLIREMERQGWPWQRIWDKFERETEDQEALFEDEQRMRHTFLWLRKGTEREKGNVYERENPLPEDRVVEQVEETVPGATIQCSLENLRMIFRAVPFTTSTLALQADPRILILLGLLKPNESREELLSQYRSLWSKLNQKPSRG